MTILKTNFGALKIQTAASQESGAAVRNAVMEDVVWSDVVSNRDHLAVTLAIVADGEGPTKAGTAAKLVVDTIVSKVRDSSGAAIAATLRSAFEAADNRLRREISSGALPNGVFVSATVVAINRNRLYLMHAGNTRAILVRDGEIVQITKDHVSRDGTVWAPTQALGLAGDFQPETGPWKVGSAQNSPADYLELRADDTVVLCTDALLKVGGPVNTQDDWRLISPTEFLAALREGDLKRIARRLITAPMSNNVDDNVSVIVLRAIGRPIPPRNVLYLAGAAVLIGVITLIAGLLAIRSSFAPATEAPLYADQGLAIVQQIDGTASVYEPGRNTWSPLFGGSGIPGGVGYRIRVDSGRLALIVVDSNLYVGDGAEIDLLQLASTNPAEQNRVILSQVNGNLLLMHSSSQITFIVRVGDRVSATLMPGVAGAIGISQPANHVIIDCLDGQCAVGLAGASYTLAANQRLIIGANTNQLNTVELPSDSLRDWLALCNQCQLGPTATMVPPASSSPPASTSTPAAAFTPTFAADVKGFAIVNSDDNKTVRLRISPSLSAEYAYILHAGDQVELLDELSKTADGITWVKVRTAEGNTGWVALELLKISSASQP